MLEGRIQLPPIVAPPKLPHALAELSGPVGGFIALCNVHKKGESAIGCRVWSRFCFSQFARSHLPEDMIEDKPDLGGHELQLTLGNL